MRWKPHVRFGGRAEETDQPKGWHRASVRSNHTHAAHLIAAGVDPLTISRRLGHASVAFTLDRYGHLFPSLEAALTDRLDVTYTDALAGATPGAADDRLPHPQRTS